MIKISLLVCEDSSKMESRTDLSISSNIIGTKELSLGTKELSLGIEKDDYREGKLSMSIPTMTSKSTDFFDNINSKSSFLFDDDDSDNTSLASFETVQTVERVIRNQTSGFIFLLLLQMESKKFEIIQMPIFFNATTSINPLTVGHILHHITLKATDPMLAQQPYRGICRPSNGIEMTNLFDSVMDEDGECRIVPGEVVVPIPERNSGSECMNASQYVLNLPAVDSLFQKSNPLTPTRSSGRRDAAEMKSLAITDIDGFKCNDSIIDRNTLRCPLNVVEVESLNENLVQVVIPRKKSLNIKDLIECPNRVLLKYEEKIVYRLQKKLFLKSQKDARLCARLIVKGTEVIFMFVLMRSIILAGIRCIIDIPTNTTAVGSTERPIIVGFVEFALFLSLLVWLQKRSSSTMQKKVLRSSRRKLIYGC